MEPSVYGVILLIVVILIGSACCSGVEAAFLAVNSIRILEIASRQKPKSSANQLLKLRKHLGRTLTVITITNNGFNIIGSLILGVYGALVINSSFGLTLFSIAFYILVVLVGEVLPKALGTKFSIQIALLSVPILRILNTLMKNKKDASDKYFFVTNNGRWTGFVDENILKTVSIRKWERNFVGDFKKPIDRFVSVYTIDILWKTIERIEETGEGFILVLNSADIPLVIIDRSKIGNFVLNKLGFNFPSEIVNKLNYKNQYPLGIELPRIINSMKQKGDL